MNVTQFKPGDEVFGACRGAFAEYAGCVSGVRPDAILRSLIESLIHRLNEPMNQWIDAEEFGTLMIENRRVAG
jgi:NADPH:quinone reductase-like Zn-dependent oxidoreductase